MKFEYKKCEEYNIYDIGELALCNIFIKNGILEWCACIVIEENKDVNIDEKLVGKLSYYNVYFDSNRYCLPTSHLKKI
jgi:hypothetical protein